MSREWHWPAFRYCRKTSPALRAYSMHRAVRRPTNLPRPSFQTVPAHPASARSSRRPGPSGSGWKGAVASIDPAADAPCRRQAWRWRWRGWSRDWRGRRPNCRNDASPRASSRPDESVFRRGNRGIAWGDRRRALAHRMPRNRSAFSSSRSCSQTWRKSGEPISSPVSMMNLALKPSRPPRVSRTARSADILMLCWPLLSAVPRP